MSERLTYLLNRWLDSTASPEDQKELWGMVLDSSHQQQLETELEDVWTTLEGEEQMSVEKIDELFKKIDSGSPGIIHPGRRLLFWTVAAAASIILAIGLAIWHTKSSIHQPDTIVLRNPEPDIPPGGNKATLTLANGSTIVLDNAADGVVTNQGRVNIIKLGDGQLAYKGKDTVSSVNTLTTPFGGMYHLTLPDGSSVWLNAASAITYPTAFVGSKREVLIRGEAYFEVKKDAAKPFIVNLNSDTKIEVLGTRFNINAYENENMIRTTLLEGAVKVTQGKLNDKEHGVILKPGQQTVTDADNGTIKVIDIPDPDAAIAWKNGLFNFEGMSLESAMRQLARWYDIQIVFEQPLRAIQFGGTLKRNLPLSDILHFLASAGLHYRMEEKNRLIILNN
ncbi:MAG: FecR domain-containing protein [Bacteroidetes bacterium]|nr:FecR domain-containing protein [Bacteroidota bacterium]